MYTACLLLLLGSDSFKTRDAAEHELARLAALHPDTHGRDAALWEGATSDPEAASRVRRAARLHFAWRAERYVPSSVLLWPLDHDDVCSAAWSGEHYAAYYRGRTEQQSRAMIRDGTPECVVDFALRWMWNTELELWPSYIDRPLLPTKWEGGYP